MKKKVEKQPVMHTTHLPLILLGVAMSLYGLITALVWSVSSRQAMRGLITAGQQRARLAAFEDMGGLIAGIVFLVLFVWCAVASRRGPRAAFIVGALASFGPILTGRADGLLFDTLGLRLPAGSVIASALATIVFALPMVIFFIILTSSRRVPRGCRWLAFGSIFLVLATAFFPIVVTVFAFLVKPGDPGVGRMMEVGALVVKLRYILPGLSLLGLAALSLQFKKKQIPVGAQTKTQEGGTK
jgi:hypothetical protein